MFELLAVSGKQGPVIPNSGPGPNTLLYGDEQAGYFGPVSNQQMFLPSEVAAAGPLTVGTVQNEAYSSLWFKFIYKGKILYMPRRSIRSGVTWDAVYNAGLAYGLDNNGPYPTTTPTNQKRTLSKVDGVGKTWNFLVRLPTSLKTDPTVDIGATQALDSEIGKLYENMVPTSGNPVKWSTLAVSDMDLAQFLCRESLANRPTVSGVSCGGNSNYLYRAVLDKVGTADWRPVLELIPD